MVYILTLFSRLNRDVHAGDSRSNSQNALRKLPLRYTSLELGRSLPGCAGWRPLGDGRPQGLLGNSKGLLGHDNAFIVPALIKEHHRPLIQALRSKRRTGCQDRQDEKLFSARSNGVKALLSLALTSAPLARRSSATSLWPQLPPNATVSRQLSSY